MRAVYPSITTSFEPMIFPNQDHFGKEIANEFMDRNIVSILALALLNSLEELLVLSLLILTPLNSQAVLLLRYTAGPD